MLRGYTERAPLGQKAGHAQNQLRPDRAAAVRRSRSSSLIIVVLFLALLVWPGRRTRTWRPQRIEQDVTNELAH